MNKLIFTTIFCLCLTISTVAQTYSGGSGVEADPYRISSQADMQDLAVTVNGKLSYSVDKYFILTQDIKGVTTIIGTNDFPFQGVFDGGGYKITVSINTSVSCVGVFGYISGATIKNLSVAGNITRISTNHNAYVGSVCGYANSSTITNCYNTGSVSSSSSYPYTGGICGYVYYGTVANCYNSGNVSSTSFYPYPYAGGICGYLYGTTAKIDNCIAVNATVTAKRGNNYDSFCTGRITGYTNGTVKNCRALASMKINGVVRSSQAGNTKDGKDVDTDIDMDYFLILIQILTKKQ
jgi:hypothetical protein